MLKEYKVGIINRINIYQEFSSGYTLAPPPGFAIKIINKTGIKVNTSRNRKSQKDSFSLFLLGDNSCAILDILGDIQIITDPIIVYNLGLVCQQILNCPFSLSIKESISSKY